MYREISDWLEQGKIKYEVDVREGLEIIPDAFVLLLSGKHRGKLIVRITEPD